MRSPTLDILRAVAVIFVFTRHSGIFPILSQMGWAGVDLFFVLSGFLVSGLLFREYQVSQRVRSGRFLLRRGFKIYPQFYLLIAITVAADAWLGWPAPGRQIASDLVFLQSYFPGLWGHAWSLAVEEHFYLLLAAVIAFLARRGGADPFRGLPKWIYVIFAAALCARIATWLHDPQWSYAANLFPSHLRLDSLLAGVLLSYYHAFHGPAVLAFVNRFRGWLAPVSLAAIAPTLFIDQSEPFMYTAGFSLLWLGFGLLLLIVLYPIRPPKPLGRAGRTFAALGRVSYAFYLWHLPVLAVADQLSASAAAKGVEPSVGTVFASSLLAFAGTLLIAIATTWAVEAPFLRLRDRWLPSRAKSAPLTTLQPVPQPEG